MYTQTTQPCIGCLPSTTIVDFSSDGVFDSLNSTLRSTIRRVKLISRRIRCSFEDRSEINITRWHAGFLLELVNVELDHSLKKDEVGFIDVQYAEVDKLYVSMDEPAQHFSHVDTIEVEELP